MRRNIIIALVVLSSIAAGGYFLVTTYQPSLLSNITDALFTKNDQIPTPTEDTERSVTQKIVAATGGKIRILDAAGLVMTLNVPAGALTSDTEITLTPFTYSTSSPLQHGVAITPSDLMFTEPVSLTYDWNMLTQIAGKKSTISKRPDIVAFDPETKNITLTPISPATLAPNYVPATITKTGWYGVTTDSTLVISAAKATLSSGVDTLALLAASITLINTDAHTSASTKQAEELLETVLNLPEPPIYELELATILEEKLKQSLALIHKAQAYGLFDGYLQLRCNQDITTYEEALIAAKTAQTMGYKKVAETCIARAEKILMAMAEEVVADRKRPIIDVIEIQTQMQLLGLDDGGRGKVLAESMTIDVEATNDALNRRLAGETATESDATARKTGRSRPPLTGNDTNLPNELFAIQFLPLLGINAYDEESWKSFADTTHTQMDGMIMLGREACGSMGALFGELGMAVPAEMVENCDKIESEKMTDGMDVWHREVDEYAEGVTDVQNNQTPNSNWSDTSELDEYVKWLEN